MRSTIPTAASSRARRSAGRASARRTARASSTRTPSCRWSARDAGARADRPGCGYRGSGGGSARRRGWCRSARSPGAPPRAASPRGRRRTARPGPDTGRAARFVWLARFSRVADGLVDRRIVRLGEHFGPQDLVELLAGHELLLQHEVIDARAGGERLARDLARARIAEERVERGDQRGGFIEQAARALGV